MSSTSFAPLRPFLFVTAAALATLGAVGCSGEIAPQAPNGNTQSGVNASSVCAAKACGVDCTPAGSDEPFNCNLDGACVAAGQPLSCKVCAEFLGDCQKGDEPADLDGDGCIDGCRPIE
jgi:hypothetical protein